MSTLNKRSPPFFAISFSAGLLILLGSLIAIMRTRGLGSFKRLLNVSVSGGAVA